MAASIELEAAFGCVIPDLICHAKYPPLGCKLVA